MDDRGRTDFTLSDVVERGMCVGCGACGAATGGAIPITITPFGMRQAVLDNASASDLERGGEVCPFSDQSPDETSLGAPTAAGRALPFDERLGHVGRVFAGRRRDDATLPDSSSGGLTSWLIERLLAEGHVDAVLHVGRSDDDSLFGYRESSTVGEVEQNRKSMYYSTSFAEVVQKVRGNGKKYAVVGVPCFITALRHLARTDDALADQFVFYVGVVCGHLKSAFFAESLAWQVGVPPDDVAAVDFRVKAADRPSYNYDFAAQSRSTGEWKSAPTLSLVGGNWGTGAFQPEACNFCDDVFAETADVAFGDAWLPQFEADSRGTNVVVTRNPVIDQIFAEGETDGALTLEAVTADDAASSQGGNYRHRRLGLAVRLADDLAAGLRVPSKRVAPDANAATPQRRKLIRLRRQMSRESHERFAAAKAAGDLDQYVRPMRAAWRRYGWVDRPLGSRLVTKVRAVSRRMPRRTR